MMSKRPTLFLLLLLFALPSWAAMVKPEAAKQVALQCYQSAAARLGAPGFQSGELQLLQTISFQREEERLPLYYVFANEQAADFVIVAAEDRVLPILGYSLNTPYTTDLSQQPDPFRKWMQYYRWQIETVIVEDLPATEAITAEWEAYRSGAIQERSVLSVDPLVTTKWDQPFPFNALCPQDPGSGQRAVVGCVATAMAQIMRYHAHPQQGTGFHSYNHPQFGTVSANFGSTTYNWNNMPNIVTNYNEDVARLSFHCGVSIEMGYGVQVSGVSSLEGVSNALKQYFAYDQSTTQFIDRQNYSDANWLQIMLSELDNGRPVEYGGIGQGGGHAWVMDGYDGNFFHMNWGWGGFQDGYFTLNNLNPSTGGTGAGNSGYNSFQQAVIGIQPAPGSGGGGGGGNPPTEAYTNLGMYSNVFLTPFPIQFAESFDLQVDIANFGNEIVSGDVGAAIFSEDGNTFIDFADIVSATMDPGFFYSFTFSNDGLPTSPGRYLMAFFYRPNNGEWTLIPPGDFANPITFDIQGPFNDIQLYAPMTPSSTPIVQGQPFTVSLDYANFSSFNYSGDFSLDLYTLEGEYIDELSVVSGDLCANCHFTSGITYQVEGLDVEPGSYLLASWNRPVGQDWRIVGNGDYQNPVQIQVAAPAIQADPYENNNETAQAFPINLSFSGNNAQWSTNGTNMHTAEDQDYFRVTVPQGFRYQFTGRAHDSYNSGNGQSYTNDVLFGFESGNGWSDLHDDVMPQSYTVDAINGDVTVFIGLSSYFVGTLGTYGFDLNVSRTTINSTTAATLDQYLNVGPNPSQGQFNIDLQLPTAAEVQIRVQDINGRLLLQQDWGTQQQFNHELSLPNAAPGVYLLQLEVDGTTLRRRLVIAK
jgi:hypothetical protein